MSTPLSDIRVVDLLGGRIAGYCTKLFTDAGADVILIEDEQGDPLRFWRVGGEVAEGNGALFRYLRHGQRSSTTNETEWVSTADLVIIGRGGPSPDELRKLRPGLVVLAISPYGLDGPFSDHPATEFTIQADSGGIGTRGLPWQEPFAVGGRTGDWFAATFAAVASAAAVIRAKETGHGEIIDFSEAEAANICMTNFAALGAAMIGPEAFEVSARSLETPSIEPTKTGYFGVNTNTRQQWEDFCLVIERPDLIEKYAQGTDRFADWETWTEIVRAHTSDKTLEELLDFATALRIPVAPVCNGQSVLAVDHFKDRGVYTDDPEGEFKMPRRTWRIDDEPPPPIRPAPPIDNAGSPESRSPAHAEEPSTDPSLPLEGITILDNTAWWAGPSATTILATLGAEVIHVESARHPDGIRMYVGKAAGSEQWWEKGWMFQSINPNKLDLCLDLSSERGREIYLDLVEQVDVVVENYTPRVFENFGFTPEVLFERNPQLIFVRMPAFGLDGPWRDRPGFAQTMEQCSGLAWITGYADDQPRIQRGPCDPNAGMHAAFGIVAALVHRTKTGRGCFVESPMVESALNIAAEQVVEWTAYGTLMERNGNRGPYAAPQGIYRCDKEETWVAIGIETDAQWQALSKKLNRADLSDLSLDARQERHDEIDELIQEWAKRRTDEDAAAEFVAAGIPAAIVRDPRCSSDHPQFLHRRFIEASTHPIIGTQPTQGMPFRFASVDKWLQSPAPTLGQHNAKILARVGIGEEELQSLQTAGVVSTELA